MLLLFVLFSALLLSSYWKGCLDIQFCIRYLNN